MCALTGKKAIVTGGASGIGRAVAVLFAQAGATVSVVDLDEPKGSAVVGAIIAAGGQAMFIRADVSRAEDCQNAVAETASALGGGAIINNASGWGLTGGGRAAVYCASKDAVVNLTRVMAIDHGAKNIRVNCIAPGDTDTSMLRDEAKQLGEPVDAFLKDSADRPLGCISRPEEIAAAVLYLASDAASFVTGAILTVDGGSLAD